MIALRSIADVSADGLELADSVEPRFFHHDRAGAASEKMTVPEWMERMGATAIGAYPTRHRCKGEVGDPHRLLLMSFRENFLALSRREHVEQFRRGNYVNVQAETGIVDQRQCLVHERIRDSRALQHNCTLRMTTHGTQAINALRGQRGRRQA